MFSLTDVYSEEDFSVRSRRAYRSLYAIVKKLQESGCNFKNEMVYLDGYNNEYPFHTPPHNVFKTEGNFCMALSWDGKDFLSEEDRSEFNSLMIEFKKQNLDRIRELYNSRKEIHETK